MRFKNIIPGMIIHCQKAEARASFLSHLDKEGYLWDGGKISIREAINKSYLSSETYFVIKNGKRIFSAAHNQNAVELDDLILPDILETPKFQPGDMVRLRAGNREIAKVLKHKESRDGKTRLYQLELPGRDPFDRFYYETDLELVKMLGSAAPASEVFEWLDWLRQYDFCKDADGLAKVFNCSNADEIFGEYPIEIIIRKIQETCGDVLYRGQFVKAYERIRKEDLQTAHEIARRVKDEADKLVGSLKQKETVAPLLDDGMLYRWYYVPDENHYDALKISLYDIEASAFTEETDGFPKWIMAVTDGNGYGTILTSVEEIRKIFHSYMDQTDKMLGIELAEESSDGEKYQVVNYYNEYGHAAMAVLTKPVCKEEAEMILEEILLKRLVTLGVVHTETEAKEMYATAGVSSPGDDTPELRMDEKSAVIYFGDGCEDRYEIVPCAE